MDLNVKTIKTSKSVGCSSAIPLSKEYRNIKPCLMCSAFFNEDDLYCEDCRGVPLNRVKEGLEAILTEVSFKCVLNEIFIIAVTKGKGKGNWDYSRLRRCVIERLNYTAKRKIFEELVTFNNNASQKLVVEDPVKFKERKFVPIKKRKLMIDKIKSCNLN